MNPNPNFYLRSTIATRLLSVGFLTPARYTKQDKLDLYLRMEACFLQKDNKQEQDALDEELYQAGILVLPLQPPFSPPTRASEGFKTLLLFVDVVEVLLGDLGVGE